MADHIGRGVRQEPDHGFGDIVGWPIRRNGSPAATAAMSPTPECSIMSVTTRPGAIALIRTPRGAASSAAERIMEIAAAFEAE